jgi:type II secretory pathway component PulM
MRDLWNRLRAFFDNLSPRERILTSAVGGLAALGLIYFGVVAPLLATSQNVERRLQVAEQQLDAMTRLRREFDDVDRRLTAVEQRIQGGSRGNLLTTLETLARQASVNVESMEPQATPANDRYRETKMELALSGVSLTQTVEYLHQIESAKQVLSVKSLRIRARLDKPELLDVSFTVSSFEPL